MQGIAAWLIARPQNGVLALAGTLLLPAPQFTSGVVLVVLVLALGTGPAVLAAVLAGLLLLPMALLVGVPLTSLPTIMVMVWLPMYLLAALLASSKSLPMTLQVSVLVMVAGVLLFNAVVVDPVAFWQPVLDTAVELWRQNGMQEQAAAIASQPEVFAELAAVMAGWSIWTVYVVGLLWGYWLFRQLKTENGEFGHFQNLNFGRVIAMTLVLAIGLGLLFGANWLTNIALLLMGVFWLQGLALVHWMQAKGLLPIFALIAVYVLLPVLHVVLIMALAFVGYTDAWFDYRRRFAKKQT
jgi:hypothetical protein